MQMYDRQKQTNFYKPRQFRLQWDCVFEVSLVTEP